MYDEDYIDNIFSAAYTPTTRWGLIKEPSSAPVQSKPIRRPKSAVSRALPTHIPALKPAQQTKKPRPKSATGTKKKVKRSPYMMDQTNIMKKLDKPAPSPRLHSHSQPQLDPQPPETTHTFTHIPHSLAQESSLLSSTSSHKRLDTITPAHTLSQTEISHPYTNETYENEASLHEPSIESIPPTPEQKITSKSTSKAKNKSAVQTIRNMTRTSLETPSDFPEFMELRENYIRQIIALEQYEMFIQESNIRSDISVSNFLHLLVCLRKVSFRIADTYRKLLQFRTSANDIFELHAYIVKMATDTDCINRQPFLNWMGISPILNPFMSIRRIDGSNALLAPPVDDIPRLKFLVLENTQVSKELAPTRVEIELADDLGPIVLNAYANHQQALRRRIYSAVDENEPLDDVTVNSHGSKVKKGYRDQIHQRRKEFFSIWRRTYLVNVGVRSLVYARNYNVCRKVMLGWQRHVWQSIGYRRLQVARWDRVKAVVFSGWSHYLYWCRRYNVMYYNSIYNLKKRIFTRWKYFEAYIDENRRFRKRHAQLPMIITFRELKWNAIASRFLRKQRLKHPHTKSIADYNLKWFCFSRWTNYSRVAVGFEAMDVALLILLMRNALHDWKAALWPHKYRKKRTRPLKSLTSWAMYGEDVAGFEEHDQDTIAWSMYSEEKSSPKKGWLSWLKKE